MNWIDQTILGQLSLDAGNELLPQLVTIFIEDGQKNLTELNSAECKFYVSMCYFEAFQVDKQLLFITLRNFETRMMIFYHYILHIRGVHSCFLHEEFS